MANPDKKIYKPTHLRLQAKKTFNGRAAIDNLYGSQWETYRKKFLHVNPQCYCCTEPATVVDHLQPHKGDFTLFWKVDNYVPLCVSHHNTVTNMFDRRATRGTMPLQKMEWMAGNRTMAGLTHKVKIVPFDADLMHWIIKIKGQLNGTSG